MQTICSRDPNHPLSVSVCLSLRHTDISINLTPPTYFYDHHNIFTVVDEWCASILWTSVPYYLNPPNRNTRVWVSLRFCQWPLQKALTFYFPTSINEFYYIVVWVSSFLPHDIIEPPQFNLFHEVLITFQIIYVDAPSGFLSLFFILLLLFHSFVKSDSHSLWIHFTKYIHIYVKTPYFFCM